MTRTLTVLLLLAVLALGSPVRAQPVPGLTPNRDAIPKPQVDGPATGGAPSWEETGRHFKITAVYDGRRVKPLRVVAGKGTARSYLSGRPDIVVLLRDGSNNVLRQFNLPDPLEVRVRDRDAAQLRGVPEPTMDTRDGPFRGGVLTVPDRGIAAEHTMRRKTAQFDVFVPRLDGAKWLEFRANKTTGRLLGKVDLGKVQ